MTFKTSALKFGAILPFVLAVAACSTTDTPVAGVQLSAEDAALSPKALRLKTDIAYLSSDALEGREAGTLGYEKAADYVAAQFKAMKLEPMGGNGSYFQPVPLANITRDLDAAEMVIQHADGTTEIYEHLVDWLVGTPPDGVNMEMTAPVVFAGYGIDAPRFGVNDYEGLNVVGKIVVTLSGAPLDMPSEERAHYGSSSTRAKIASDHGAVGLVTLYSKASEARYPWDRVIATAGSTRMEWLQEDGTTLNTAPNIKVTGTLSASGSAKLFEGAEKSWDEVLAEAATEGVRPKGFSLPITMSLKGKATYESVESKNVVAMLPGSDPVLKNEYVVLSAHLDHIGISKNIDKDADVINNGALDNATGIATMLEEARTFIAASKKGDKPKRSILFVAVTAEEKGLIGSDYFATNPTVDKKSMVANVNLDMPIIKFDFQDVIAFGEQHSTMGEYIQEAAESMGITVSPDPVPNMALFVRSDHYSFVKQGVPSVFLFLGFADGGEENFQDFMGSCYHRPCDEIDDGLDFEVGAKFAELNYRIAKAVANAPERPKWNEGNFFGETFGK